jgi:hypothetical protein
MTFSIRQRLNWGGRMSTKELQEALVLSSRTERTLFERRNTFDLVVLCDGESGSFGDPSTPLGVLFRIIYETEFLKPLRRSPVFLQGGIKAWGNEVGEFIGTQAKEDVVVASSADAGKRLSRKPAVSGKTSGSSPHTRMPQDAVSPSSSMLIQTRSDTSAGSVWFVIWSGIHRSHVDHVPRTRRLASDVQWNAGPFASPDRRYDVSASSCGRGVL